jgi:hypothetical protein
MEEGLPSDYVDVDDEVNPLSLEGHTRYTGEPLYTLNRV